MKYSTTQELYATRLSILQTWPPLAPKPRGQESNSPCLPHKHWPVNTIKYKYILHPQGMLSVSSDGYGLKLKLMLGKMLLQNFLFRGMQCVNEVLE